MKMESELGWLTLITHCQLMIAKAWHEVGLEQRDIEGSQSRYGSDVHPHTMGKCGGEHGMHLFLEGNWILNVAGWDYQVQELGLNIMLCVGLSLFGFSWKHDEAWFLGYISIYSLVHNQIQIACSLLWKDHSFSTPSVSSGDGCRSMMQWRQPQKPYVACLSWFIE